MTDLEKTAVLVERLFGGKVEHALPDRDAGFCTRPHCGAPWYVDEPCEGFNPFALTQDAFAVMNKVVSSGARMDFKNPVSNLWQASIHVNGSDVSAVAKTAPRAIAEACYLAVSK